MRNKIYKYQLSLTYDQIVLIPRGAEILSVQEQNGVPTMWAKVDPDSLIEDRTFMIIGTGQVVPEDLIYIGTVQISGYVWHIFEKPTETE